MATSSKSPFEVSDFSLGITDDPFESNPSYSIEMDNFNIEPDGSALSRPGSDIDDSTNPQIPSGTERIGAMINYANDSNLLIQSLDKVYFRDPSAYTTITGPIGNDVFSVGAATNNISYAQWNKQVYLTNDGYPRPMKIYKDSAGDFQVNTSGLPAIAAPTYTPAAGANTYLYAIHYQYEYTVGSQTFQDVGPTTQTTVSAADAPDANQIALSVIPVLSNGASDNWDTATITVQIFRTINAGTTFYRVGEATNGTTTFNDTVSDATLQTNVLMYTQDGTLDYDPAPLHKFIHIVNNIAYYGYIKDGSVEYPFKLRQSIPANPSGCPADFEIDLEDEITGIGSVSSIPIVFCERYVYRLEGNYDQFGRGGINFVRISDTAGCISHLSIVSAEGSIFWAGNDGIYESDGYNVRKISDKINSRYRNMKAASSDVRRIYGKFDEENRRVVWALQQNSSSPDNDSVLQLDLRWGVRPHSTFTTWSGSTLRAASLEFFNELLHRGDDNGYVFYHDQDLLSDRKVDTIVAAADWETQTIIWNYKSCNYNFGSNFFRKKPTRMLLTARNIANTSIQINSIDDDGKRIRALKPIRWRRNFIWGDVNFVWGSLDCAWNSYGVIEQWRRFPAGGLRVSYIQLQITNAYSVITSSDSLGLVTVDATANTITLVDAPTRAWPAEIVDYFISTANDNYSRQFRVLSRDSDSVITVVDSGAELVSGNFEWLLKGYKRGEPLSLQGYTVHIANEDQNQMTYHTGDDGANA